MMGWVGRAGPPRNDLEATLERTWLDVRFAQELADRLTVRESLLVSEHINRIHGFATSRTRHMPAFEPLDSIVLLELGRLLRAPRASPGRSRLYVDTKVIEDSGQRDAAVRCFDVTHKRDGSALCY